jgi:glycosyltransferase
MVNISIITPVWNNAQTIAHNIRSIADQSVASQHILVDGVSTDGTLEIIESTKPPGSIIVSEPDNGMYDAINKGLKFAQGEIVGVLNSDDFYPTNRVLAQVLEAFADPDIDACYGDLFYVDRLNTDKVVRNWKSGQYDPRKFYSGWMPPHPTFFVRRQIYEKYGGFRLDLGSAADYELMLRMLLKHGARAAYIPQVLVHMRNEGMSNSSLKNRLRANRFDRQAWRVNDIRPRPWTLLAKPLRKIGQWA